MTDLVTFGETMLRFAPIEDRLETATELSFRTAGAESNVAIAAERLGADTTWVSKVPDSPLGRRVVSDVQRHGVGTGIVWATDARQGTYYIDSGGRPRGTNVIYDRDGTAVQTATTDEIAPHIDFDGTDYCYISGITPALSSTLRTTTRDVFETAQETSMRTVFDLNYRSKLWTPAQARETYRDLLDLVDIAVVARRDAATVLDESGAADAVGSRIAETHDCETVIVTRGAEGATAVHDGATYEQTAFEADTTDPIGTGDAFVGGFLARRLDGGDISTALEYAAATAAVTRTVNGDHAVTTPAEVDGVIDGGSRIDR